MKFSDIFPWNWGKEKKKAHVGTVENGPGVYSPLRSDRANRDNWTKIGSKDPSYSNSVGYKDNRAYASTTTYNDPVLDPLSLLNPINMVATAASVVDTAPSEVQPNHEYHHSSSSNHSSHDHSSSSYDDAPSHSSSSSDWSSSSSSSDFSTSSSDSGSSSFSTGGDF